MLITYLKIPNLKTSYSENNFNLGLDGINGSKPPDITDPDELKKKGFSPSTTSEYSGKGKYTVTYCYYGGWVTFPTYAGDGGCGAPGGYPGKSLTFGFENAQSFALTNNEGIIFRF